MKPVFDPSTGKWYSVDQRGVRTEVINSAVVADPLAHLRKSLAAKRTAPVEVATAATTVVEAREVDLKEADPVPARSATPEVPAVAESPASRIIAAITNHVDLPDPDRRSVERRDSSTVPSSKTTVRKAGKGLDDRLAKSPYAASVRPKPYKPREARAEGKGSVSDYKGVDGVLTREVSQYYTPTARGVRMVKPLHGDVKGGGKGK